MTVFSGSTGLDGFYIGQTAEWETSTGPGSAGDPISLGSTAAQILRVFQKEDIILLNNNDITVDTGSHGAVMREDNVPAFPDAAQWSYDLGAGQVDTVLDTLANVRATFYDGPGNVLASNVIIYAARMTNGDTFLIGSIFGNPMFDAVNTYGDIEITNIVSVTAMSGISAASNIDINDASTMAICFAGGTRIETCDGPVPVEDLRAGTMVRTLDDGYRPVRWIAKTDVSPADLAAHPEVRPIRFRRGVLGHGLPARDLVVSPQHRMLISSPVALRMFGARDILAPAKQLLGWPGIERVEACAEGVSYHHLLFDRHQVIFAEGAPTESLLPGPQALSAVGPAARAELAARFPDQMALCPPARLIPARNRLVRKLVERHLRNGKPLLAGAIQDMRIAGRAGPGLTPPAHYLEAA